MKVLSIVKKDLSDLLYAYLIHLIKSMRQISKKLINSQKMPKIYPLLLIKTIAKLSQQNFASFAHLREWSLQRKIWEIESKHNSDLILTVTFTL